MNYSQFKSIIKNLEIARDRSHSAYKLGLNLMDYDESYQEVISTLIDCIFTKEGKDWIDWYLYEKPGLSGNILHASDKNGNEICHTIHSLWETVKSHNTQQNQ